MTGFGGLIGDAKITILEVNFYSYQREKKSAPKSSQKYLPEGEENEIVIQNVRVYEMFGKKKFYTEDITAQEISGLGIEMEIKNNTRYVQRFQVGCCIYDPMGETKYKKNVYFEIDSGCLLQQRFSLNKSATLKLCRGKWKSQIWVCDKKIKRFFNIL